MSTAKAQLPVTERPQPRACRWRLCLLSSPPLLPSSYQLRRGNHGDDQRPASPRAWIINCFTDLLPTAIPRCIHRFSSDYRSLATLGVVSTWMGDRLGTPRAVGILFFFFSEAQVWYLVQSEQFKSKVLSRICTWGFVTPNCIVELVFSTVKRRQYWTRVFNKALLFLKALTDFF